MKPARVLISVLNWNNSADTIRCLQSIAQSEYSDYDLLVVDNASQDESVLAIHDQFPNLHILQLSENEGYAGGHHHAVSYALEEGFELVLLLNNDVLLRSNTLSELVKAYQQYGDAIYGAVPIHSDDTHTDKRVRFHYKFLQLPYREQLFDLNTHRPFSEIFPTQDSKKVASISGSIMLIPLAVVRQHGYMDSDFFMYSEETDYCFRLRQAGVASYMIPSAIVEHGGASSSKKHATLQKIVLYYRIRNQLVRIKRYQSTRILTLALIKNAVLTTNKLIKGDFKAVGYMLRANIDGLRNRLGKTYAPEDYLE